jgi:3-oxoacyl-[acyl-carrier-protein] synthase-3
MRSEIYAVQTRRIKILGTGKYLPDQALTAESIANRLGVVKEWVEQHTGVMVRHFVRHETASEMGAAAARDALKNAGLTFQDIDCLVCTSGTMEQPIPCTASLIKQAMGEVSSGIPAFDVNSTCLSFIAGLDVMSYMVAAGRYRRVLLVSTEIASKGLDWKDKESSSLFGDGAAAVIISSSGPDEQSQILFSRIETYSHGAHLSEIRGGGTKHPAVEFDPKTLNRYLFSMDGKGIFKLSAKVLPGFYNQLLASTQLSTDDLELVIPHQASMTACKLIRKRLNIPEDKFFMTVHNHGNTIAASIPMGLHEAIRQNRLQRGDRFMLLGTSAGFSVGGMILDY